MLLTFIGLAIADPCGMVFPPPPPELLRSGGAVLQRDGAQRTWVTFSEGVETMVLRPGFKGKVEEFGMLIPFPSPPSLRKVDENVFSHIEGAVDPPPITVDVMYPRRQPMARSSAVGMLSSGAGSSGGGGPQMVEPELGYNEVRVLREQAVGMYEVAVLEAGSPAALSRWMEDNGFVYPEGMDEGVSAYVESRWCFVAIKARVGSGAGIEPRPGMRSADASLPGGASFDGFVQAMGFRFETEQPVVPMRLSVFNGPAERNVLYMLTDEPVAIVDLAPELVVRQVAGDELRGHLNDLIPFWFRSGRRGDVHPTVLSSFDDKRLPDRFNGVAKELIASDLLAAHTGELELAFEGTQTELLNISEALGLRGPEIDARHAAVVEAQREEALGTALEHLDGMTLTVLDGDFDVQVLARQNLGFRAYEMPQELNTWRSDPIRPNSPMVKVPAFTPMNRVRVRQGGPGSLSPGNNGSWR